MGLNKQQEKDFAQALYVKGDLTQKEIASRVGVSEQTLVKWVKDSNWDKLKRSLLVTKKEQLNYLYEILEGLTREGKEALSDNDPETVPNADGIIKITKAIKTLETETGIGETVDICTQLIQFLQESNPQLAKQVMPYFDTFIKTKLS